jgi:hypothetical protein
VREVNPRGKTVWEFRRSDLPSNVVLHNTQTAEAPCEWQHRDLQFDGRYKARRTERHHPGRRSHPGKRTVWVLQHWKNLRPATTAQFLDEPGLPEHPGDPQR